MEPRQLGLWEFLCPSDCLLWDECGGSNTAPCGCVWHDPAKQYNCANCDLLCRDRLIPPRSDFAGDNFQTRIREGKPLQLVHLEQQFLQFPILIPTRTNDIPGNTILPVEWAGIDAGLLFTKNRRGPVRTRSWLQTAASIREFAKVSPSSQLIAVLNGKDWVLEGFWGMPRKAFYSRLEQCGFSAITGPTFSVTDESPTMPASHNVCMLLRHHRVIDELSATSLLAIPNLYWRSRRDRQRWAVWLSEQQDIHTVSRDFSRTIQPAAFREELTRLLEILVEVPRQLHVLLVGVGVGNAREAMLQVAEVGATCSIVTSDPILRAVLGGRRLLFRGANQPAEKEDPETMRAELAWENLKVMEEHLLEVAASISVSSMRNGRLFKAEV